MPRPNKVLQGCPHAWVFRPGSNGGLDYQISQTVFCENTGGISIEQIQFSLILSSKACCSFTIQKSPTARNNKNTLEEGQGKKRKKKKKREKTHLSLHQGYSMISNSSWANNGDSKCQLFFQSRATVDFVNRSP